MEQIKDVEKKSGKTRRGGKCGGGGWRMVRDGTGEENGAEWRCGARWRRDRAGWREAKAGWWKMESGMERGGWREKLIEGVE